MLARCIEHDLIIVTENARDFRALASRAEIHPGMIILPCLDRVQAKALIKTAIAYLQQIGDPADVMVKRVLEAEAVGTMALYDLPEG